MLNILIIVSLATLKKPIIFLEVTVLMIAKAISASQRNGDPFDLLYILILVLLGWNYMLVTYEKILNYIMMRGMDHQGVGPLILFSWLLGSNWSEWLMIFCHSKIMSVANLVYLFVNCDFYQFIVDLVLTTGHCQLYFNLEFNLWYLVWEAKASQVLVAFLSFNNHLLANEIFPTVPCLWG